MKKIAIVLDSFGFFGGPERRAYRLAIGFKKKGYDITIISIMKGDEGVFSKASKEGIKAVRITDEGSRSLKSFRIDVFLKLRKILNRISPDVVFTFEFLADYSTKMALLGKNLPLITFIGSTQWKWEKKYHRKVFMKKFTNKSKFYIANSIKVKQSILRVLPEIKNKVHIIYNPIDTEYFKPLDGSLKEKTKKRFSIDNFDFIVGSVVRFYNPKGADVLIEAFYKSKIDAALVLVGDGSMKDELKRMVDNLGINDKVVFLGALEVTPEIYSMFDVCVVPSQKGGFDNVAIESMACGIPTVATNETGVGEIAKDKEDVIITDISAESIAKGIKTVYDKLIKGVGCCNNSTKTIKTNLDTEVIVDTIEELLTI